MANPFPSLLLRPSGGRDILADCTSEDLPGLWPVGGHGEYIGTAADLALVMWPTSGLAVEPIGIADPFTAGHWSHFTPPDGLWYVVHGVRKAVWSGSSSDVGKICAIAWRFAPSSSSGTGSITITAGGSTVFSQSFSAGTRYQSGVWWVTDALWDASTWSTLAVTASGSCSAAPIPIPFGAMVPGDLPAGWDPVAVPTARGGTCQRANLHVGGTVPPAATPLLPIDALEFAASVGSASSGQGPASWYPDQVWDADSLGSTPTIDGIQPHGLTTDWSLRRLAYPLEPSVEYYLSRATSGFPLIYLPSLGAFKEALNMPYFDGPHFKPDVPGYRWGSANLALTGVQSSRGQIQATYSNAIVNGAISISGTRGNATFWPGTDSIKLVVNAYSPWQSGDHIDVVIKEWTTGTTLYSGTVSLTGANQVVDLPITAPALDSDAVWEVSAVLNYYIYYMANAYTGYPTYLTVPPMAGIVLQPRYRPLPWNAPGADGVSMVPGGTRSAWLRDPRSRDAVLRSTATAGATTATATVPTPLRALGSYWGNQSVGAFTFSPAPGWYTASAAANASPTAATVYPYGDDEFVHLGAPPSILPAYPDRPFRLLATARLQSPVYTSRGDQLTATLTRWTPSPQAIPTNGSWLKLTLAQGAGWASFTAPADGSYTIQAAWHNAAGNPSDANRMASAFCWFAGSDADVIGGAEEVSAWWTPSAFPSVLFCFDDPSTYPYAGLGVVGFNPTGDWVGHAGELVYRWREWPTDPWSYRFAKPVTGMIATVASLGYARLGWDGKSWSQDWPAWSGTLTAGQTIYFRVHGPRSVAAPQHGGAIDTSFHFLRLLTS